MNVYVCVCLFGSNDINNGDVKYKNQVRIASKIIVARYGNRFYNNNTTSMTTISCWCTHINTFPLFFFFFSMFGCPSHSNTFFGICRSSITYTANISCSKIIRIIVIITITIKLKEEKLIVRITAAHSNATKKYVYVYVSNATK